MWNKILELINTPVGGALCCLVIYLVIHFGTGIAKRLKHAKFGPVELSLSEEQNNALTSAMISTIDRHFEKKFNMLNEQLKQLKLDTLRLQILSDSTNKEQKCKLYDEYKKLGGNSYITDWMHEYLEGN